MKKLKLLFFLSVFCINSLSVLSADNKLTGNLIASFMGNAYRAFDGDISTYYQSTTDSYAWVGLDLGERHIITKVKWESGTSGKTLLGLFQGANNPDFSDAIPIALITNPEDREREIKCSRGFRYVRYVGPESSYGKIAEIEFYGSPGKGDDLQLWQITNLPTVCINTVDGKIPYDKETYISSTFIMISEDGTKILEKSETGIKERGNASRTFPKKPWKIKFDKKQNILDAPAKAKKWTLINNYGDKSLMRNMLAFDIARKFEMEWVPFCTPVDVVLNGEYKGCYQLCDQVEVNEGRLEIDEMNSSDNSGEALTGGYFVEVDGYAYEEQVWFSTAHYGLPITIKSPDEEDITSEQIKYISDYFNTLEPLMMNINPTAGYRKMFDNKSFIQHMLVNETAGNTDTYFSTNMFKRRSDPRIYTGPVWDFDLGFNNDYRTYPVTSKSGDGFLWDTNDASSANGMKYFAERILIKDYTTKNEIFEVWKAARNNGLSAEWLIEKINEYSELLDMSQRLNFKRWPIMNQYVHMNPRIYGSYKGECDAIKNYITEQLNHLDYVIGYNPETDGLTEANIVEEVNAEYFTITGEKVNKPVEKGIYIELRGNKSRKIIIK